MHHYLLQGCTIIYFKAGAMTPFLREEFTVSWPQSTSLSADLSSQKGQWSYKQALGNFQESCSNPQTTQAERHPGQISILGPSDPIADNVEPIADPIADNVEREILFTNYSVK